jgi:hypothetical protein
MHRNRFRALVFAGITFSAVFAGGCGNNASKQPADKAEKVVELFLDAWSQGEPADKFAEPGHAVQGTDPDWQAGYRLLSFLTAEATPNPEMPDHVRCRVALSLQDQKGRTWDKEVEYDVQLGEKSVLRRKSP